MWMSSAAGSMGSFPLSMSVRMSVSPSANWAASPSVRMPCFASMAAWAREPVMSWRYMRLSKWMEELKSSAV